MRSASTTGPSAQSGPVTTEPFDVSRIATLLGVWAHPDDEAFLTAGLMARITDAGGHVACVTATRGEAGTPDPATWPAQRLGRRRSLELRASLAAVGVSDHRFLGYLDGTLASVPVEEGVARVRAAIDQVRPDTVVTFGPDGLTGHPDHAAVSTWTTRAVRELPSGPRLLHATTTGDFATRWASVNAQLNAFQPGLPVAAPPEELAFTLELDEDELDRKLVALAAQSSQVVPLLAAIGEPTLRRWWGTEAFRAVAGRSVVTVTRERGARRHARNGAGAVAPSRASEGQHQPA